MINEDVSFVRYRNPYFEKYFYDVFSMKENFHQFPDGLKSENLDRESKEKKAIKV